MLLGPEAGYAARRRRHAAGGSLQPGIDMLPDPLHPAVVHFPIALAALTPLFAA
jgi:hypothetical protein